MPSLADARKWLEARKAKVALAVVSLAVPLTGYAASADIDWSNITGIINGLAANLIPAMVTLVTAAVPLLIILAIVGFILTFLRRILDMLHFQF